MKLSYKLYKLIVSYPFNEAVVYGVDDHKNGLSKFVGGTLATISSLFQQKEQTAISERIVEFPFVHLNLPQNKDSLILDFGCDESKLSLELASLGYKVVGVDYNLYPFTHPNLKFYQGDLLKLDLKNNNYDCIISLSAIEHSGLGFYGENTSQRDDYKIIDKFHDLLKKNGILILTIPFGKSGENKLHRIYSNDNIKRLIRDKFKIKVAEFYIKKDGNWIPTSKENLKNVDSIIGLPKGVACFLLQSTA